MDPVTLSLLISTGVKLGTSAYQAYKGSQQEKEAQRAAQRIGAQQRAIRAETYQPYMQIPTMGAELARQELGQQMTSTVGALQQTGAAGVLGGMSQIAGLSADKALDIMAGLNKMEAQRDQFAMQIGAEQARQQRMLLGEQLAGAQASAAEGRLNKQVGTMGMISAVGEGAAAYLGSKPLYDKVSMGADVAKGTGEIISGAGITDESKRITFDKDTESRIARDAAYLGPGNEGLVPGGYNKDGFKVFNIADPEFTTSNTGKFPTSGGAISFN